MTVSTYALLQTAVGRWLNRSDLTADIPTFIEMAEASFKRREEFQEEFRGTLTIDAANVALPDDCREVTSLYLDGTSFRGPLEIISPEQLAIKKALFGYLGIPQYAAVSSNGTELLIAPEPSETFIAQMVYLLKLTSLSATNTSNWLLVDHPDIYLYGALVQSAPFLKDDVRIATWKDLLEGAVAELWSLLRRRQFSPNTPIQRPMRAIG